MGCQMNRIDKIIETLNAALDLVRADLAEHGDHDPDMRADEVCIEVALSHYEKRRKNARELALRQFSETSPRPVSEYQSSARPVLRQFGKTNEVDQ